MCDLDKSALRVVGSRPIRRDEVDKVTGRANFGADPTMSGMPWGRIKRSLHAHARIVSINTENARALSAVRASPAADERLEFADKRNDLQAPLIWCWADQPQYEVL